MNATFEILPIDPNKPSQMVRIYPCSPRSEEDALPVNSVVILHITSGDAGNEGEPDTDKRVYTDVPLRKGEARALASAIMGIAAAL